MRICQCFVGSHHHLCDSSVQRRISFCIPDVGVSAGSDEKLNRLVVLLGYGQVQRCLLLRSRSIQNVDVSVEL